MNSIGNKVLNPRTNRWVNRDTKTFRRLLREGVIRDFEPNETHTEDGNVDGQIPNENQEQFLSDSELDDDVSIISGSVQEQENGNDSPLNISEETSGEREKFLTCMHLVLDLQKDSIKELCKTTGADPDTLMDAVMNAMFDYRDEIEWCSRDLPDLPQRLPGVAAAIGNACAFNMGYYPKSEHELHEETEREKFQRFRDCKHKCEDFMRDLSRYLLSAENKEPLSLACKRDMQRLYPTSNIIDLESRRAVSDHSSELKKVFEGGGGFVDMIPQILQNLTKGLLKRGLPQVARFIENAVRSSR